MAGSTSEDEIKESGSIWTGHGLGVGRAIGAGPNIKKID